MATALQFALSNPKPDMDAEYNRWYGGEHFEHGLATPGILGGQRFRRMVGPWPSGKHDYLMIWEIDDPKFALEQLAVARDGEMQISPAIDMTTVQPPTMWIRASARNASRIPLDTRHRGPVVLVLFNASAGKQAELESSMTKGGVAALADLPGIVAADFLTLAEQQIRGSARKFGYALLIELFDEEEGLEVLRGPLDDLADIDRQNWIAAVFSPMGERRFAEAGNQAVADPWRWRVDRDVGGFSVRRSPVAERYYRAGRNWREETLMDIARSRTQEDSGRVLVIEGQDRLTRGMAWDQARRLASFFRARGLKPGDVISFQLPNWTEAVVLSLAARIYGLIVNPITPIYREAELGYILHDCSSKMIFVPETYRKWDYLAAVEKVKAKTPSLRDVIAVRAQSDVSGAQRWEDLLAYAPLDVDELPKVDPSAVMMVMYTAGTTARPKGVLHSHETYGATTSRLIDAWRLGESDVFFMPSPLTHITGALWSVDLPWLCGGSSVILDVWTAEDGVRCIEQNQCTLTGGATPFLQQLLKVARNKPQAVETLRLFFCGGTTVSPDLVKEAASAFPNCLFFRSYGSTESPCVTLGIRERSEALLGAETDGKITPPTEVKMLALDGPGLAPEGEEGEIAVRGPETFLGYRNPEESAAAFDEEGFFRTGDVGRRVHGDCLVITGRKKDIIIRNGENISPKEIEDALYHHPDIVEAAVVAMPSPETGEKGCAFVIAQPGAKLDLDAIRTFLSKEGFAKQKVPEHLVLVNELPRVPSGKVMKNVLRLEAKKIAQAN